MATLAEIRQRYPQYNDLSDAELADRMYERFYSDLPRDEFDARIGLRPGGTVAPGTAETPAAQGSFATDTAAEPEPSRWDLAKRGFQVGSQGAGRAFAEIAGFPVDLSAAVLGLGSAGLEKAINLALPEEHEVSLPRFSQPMFGSEHISDMGSAVAEALGIDLIEREGMSPRERLGYNINRLGTEAVTGASALARRAAQKMAEVAPQLPGRLDALIRPYREQPGRAYTQDAAAGLGSGAALTGSQELLPEGMQGPFADVAATVAGGAGGSTLYSLARSPAEVARSVRRSGIDPDIPVDPETGLPFTRREADLAAEFIQQQATNPERAAENILRRTGEFRAEGDPVPTSDLISDDIGVMALGRGARVRDQVPFEERDQALRDAATRRVLGIRDENADLRAPQRLAQTTAEAQRADAQRAVDTAQESVTGAQRQLEGVDARLRETAAPVAALRGTEGQASQRLDEVVVEQTMRPRQSENKRLIEAIDPDRTVTRDAEPFIETAREIKERAGRLSGQSGIPTEFLDRIERLAPDTGEAATVTMGELVEVRPYLNTAYERARTAGEYRLADNIGALKREINAEIDRLAQEGGPGSEAAAAAQRYYREEFAPFFGQGKGRELRDAVNRDDLSRTRTPPSATAERFLIAGGKGSDEAARDLRRILDIAPDPAAGRQAVRDYMIARLAQTVKDDGSIEPATLGKWIDHHQDILRNFPELGSEITTLRRDIVNNTAQRNRLKGEIDRFTKDLKAAEKSAADTERRIQRGILGTLIDNDPDKAVRKILNSGDREKAMAEVMDLVKTNPDALAGWKRAVADNLIDRVTTTNRAMRAGDISDGVEGPVSIAQLNRVFKQHEDALAQVFSPEEMNALRRAHTILEPLGNLGRRVTAGSDTVEKSMLARGEPVRNMLEAIIKLHFGGLRGGNIWRNIRLGTRNLPSSAADADRLIARMWFEPELAAHLLTREVEKAGTPAWNAKLTRLLGYGEAARGMVEGDDDE